MGFLDDARGVFNTPAIPGIPNSKVGDIFGIGAYLGIGNPIDEAERAARQAKEAAERAARQAKEAYENLPYIIIGGGALVLIFILNK